MKISKFIITASSAFYFAVIGDLPATIVLGILAIWEHCKIMSGLEVRIRGEMQGTNRENPLRAATLKGHKM